VHLSGDVTESDGLPRRRAFSLSHGSMSGTALRSVVPCESPLVLKSSSVSSMASKRVEDSVHCDGTGQSVFGKLCRQSVTKRLLINRMPCPQIWRWY